jgi:hypothetical protein
MIRYIRQSRHHDLLDESLSEIDEDDYTEDGSSKITTNKNSSPEKSEQKPPKKAESKPGKPEKKAEQPEKMPAITGKPEKNQNTKNA